MASSPDLGQRDVLPSTSRYELLLKIAAGGMATVYVGRSRAAGGISRLFAIKRAHGHLADDRAFRKMFVAEARLASKVHHPNVVAVQDVEELDEELLLVMDYIEGLSLAEWLAAAPASDVRERARFATRCVLDACAGLHAAHELVDESGVPLAIVHRDVSPQNILVGVDGIGRLTDFGIAKSTVLTGAASATGSLKGKLAYMAAEYIETGRVDRRADVFGLGVVTWEALTGRRLFRAASEAQLMRLALQCEVPPPSSFARSLPPSIDAVVLRATARDPGARWPTARAFGEALEAAALEAGLLGTHVEVGAAVQATAHDLLAARRAKIRGPLVGAGGGRASAPEDDAFEPVEPLRTQTLDAPALSAGAMASAASAGSTTSATSALRGPAIALAAVVLTVGTWFALDRRASETGRPGDPSAATLDPASVASLAPVTSAASVVPVASVASAASAASTSSASVAASSEAPVAPGPDANADGGAVARPRGSAGATGAHPRPPRSAAPAGDPAPPSHAPPNPYKNGR